MTGLKDWSTTAASNTASPPYGAPENTTLVSDLNNIDREIMAQVRGFYEQPLWRNLGLAFQAAGGANAVVLTGNVSTHFAAGQRVYVTDASTSQYATISNVSVATHTTLTVDITVTHPVSAMLTGPNPANDPLTVVHLQGIDGLETSLAGSSTKLATAYAVKVYADGIGTTAAAYADAAVAAEVAASNSSALLQHQEANGVAGDVYAGGSWVKTTLAKISDPDGIVGVASSVFTPVIGNYWFTASFEWFPNSNGYSGRLRLRKTSGGGSTVSQGPSQYLTNDSGSKTLTVEGFFSTATGTDTYELQLWSNTGTTAQPAVTTGSVEVYSSLLLRRIGD